MKVIDLLNKIANGEEVPKKILYVGDNYFWNKNIKFYYTQEGNSLYREMLTEGNCLDDEVEILEDKPKVTVEMTEEEYFRYLDAKNIDNQPIEDEFIDIEELKIGYPEDNPSNKYIVNEYGTKCYLTKHSKIMAEKINNLIKNQKYLKERLDKNE